MKLKQQREDIKDLHLMASLEKVGPVAIMQISKRYLNLIRMAEEQLDPHGSIVRLIKKERIVVNDGK